MKTKFRQRWSTIPSISDIRWDCNAVTRFYRPNPPSLKLSQRIYTIHKNGQTWPLGHGNPRIRGKITFLISTKEAITSHFKQLNIKKTMTYAIENSDSHLGQTQKCGRNKSVSFIGGWKMSTLIKPFLIYKHKIV